MKRSASARIVASATTSTLRLPRGLEHRLAELENSVDRLAGVVAEIADVVALVDERLGAVEQLRICPLACAHERCAFKCPTTEAVTE